MTRAFALGVIGGGRMGFAIASALVRTKIFPASRILLADPAPEARRRAARIGLTVLADAAATAARSVSILLAVKPQKISDVAETIRPHTRGKRVISILAGTTQKRLRSLLPGSRIIRVMPNTPLLAGRGASVIARDGVSPADLAFTRRLFDPLGKTWTVPEKWMNAVTALSGSGPALFCAFLEHYAAAAQKEGLPSDLATDLAVQTMAGTAALLDGISAPPLLPNNLREMVTSPGGTTEAALRQFDRRGLDRILREAVRAAVRRGRELSR